jgi:hypothetical protein
MEIIEMGLMDTKDGNTKDGDFTMGLDRLNALLTWWGILNPLGTCRFNETRHRCQVAACDIQKAYGEALGRQTDLLIAACGRPANSFPGLSQSWSPADIAAVQLQVFAAFLESALPWTRTWGVFFQTSGDRITAFVREKAQALQKQSAEELAIDEAGKRAIQP